MNKIQHKMLANLQLWHPTRVDLPSEDMPRHDIVALCGLLTSGLVKCSTWGNSNIELYLTRKGIEYQVKEVA